MNRSWLILVGGLLMGLAAYACIYQRATADQSSMEKNSRPEMAWLQKEYQLNDAQLVAVIQLHDAYHPKCAEMCRRIDNQNSKIQQLLDGTNTVTPEIIKALAE